jgi:signal transduction histidine kinase
VLTERGLGAAVESLPDRATTAREIATLPAEKLPDELELAAYFVVSEALTNVAKYASATFASVALTRTNGRLFVEVADDGVGGAQLDAGSGLRGLVERRAAMDGRLELESPPGGGRPSGCASPSRRTARTPPPRPREAWSARAGQPEPIDAARR